jgi:DNA-binding transcriptional LysR family regulator
MAPRVCRAHTAARVQDDAFPKAGVKVIRVVVGDVPRILRDIIEGAVRLHPDIELYQSDNVHLSREVAERHADAAIVAGGSAAAARLHRGVLVDNPDLKMFVVTDEGRAAHLLELRHIPVIEVSPAGLIEAIKAAVATGGRV